MFYITIHLAIFVTFYLVNAIYEVNCTSIFMKYFIAYIIQKTYLTLNEPKYRYFFP